MALKFLVFTAGYIKIEFSSINPKDDFCLFYWWLKCSSTALNTVLFPHLLVLEYVSIIMTCALTELIKFS
jgi:hypothetical protein